MFFIGLNKAKINKIKNILNSQFKISNLSFYIYYLNIFII